MSDHMEKISTKTGPPRKSWEQDVITRESSIFRNTDYIRPTAAAPYSQAIKAAGQIWVSGQLPADNTGKLIEGTIGEKTRACAQNVKAILEAGGSSIDKVVKVTVS